MLILTSLLHRPNVQIILCATVLSLCTLASVKAQTSVTANSLAELRNFGVTVNNTIVTLSANHGDPHPVTGVTTPGEYWLDGDHIANPTNSEPIFMELSGTGNTYDLSGATINVDTRKLDGFGRNLGHSSAVRVILITGSNNTVEGINLIGQDIALDTDPNKQRYADWSTRYVDMNGDDNMVDGAYVVTRGSRTDAYGLGDAFGKGAAGGITPFLSHRKASAFRVGEATNAVVNDIHLEVNTFGHGFFVQNSTNTTLTNSTVTGELFSSQGVIDHPLYQQHGHTYHQNEIPLKIISGAEGGVRMYTGSSGLTVDNVVVTNMRTGFATSLGGGIKTLNNVEAYGTESGFDLGNDTTITNAKADGVNGPIVGVDRDIRRNASIEVELVGNQPFNHDYALIHVNGNDMNVTVTSNRPAADFDNISVFRSAQFYYDNWRETNNTTTFDVPGYDHFNSVLINDTNAFLVLGEQAEGNVGRSQGGVISNGKENYYDGVTFVLTGSRLEVVHAKGLGNSGTETGAEFSGNDIVYTGTATAQTIDDNASIVEDGATLEINPGISLTNQKLTITGDGVDGNGALYSEGQTGTGTRFGSSNNNDQSTIFLSGDASIGVGIAGNQMLVGRIQGTGNLTKLGVGRLVMGKSSNYDGNLTIAQGDVTARSGVVHNDLTVSAGTSIAAIGSNAFNTTGDVDLDGTLDLNARSDSNTLNGTIGRLNGSGRVTVSNANAGSQGTLTLGGNGDDGLFTGEIDGLMSLAKSGLNNQVLSGVLFHTGTTTVNEGGLFIDGTHIGGGDYLVFDGTLGGEGTTDSALTVHNGGIIELGNTTGSFSADSADFKNGSLLNVDIDSVVDFDQLLLSGGLTIDSGATLNINIQDGFSPMVGDEFNILDFGSSTGMFGTISTSPSGSSIEWDFSRFQNEGVIRVASVDSNLLLGDCNQDGVVNFLDIAQFISSLTTGTVLAESDINQDGLVNFLDIAPFILILSSN